jgi:hypothetical protein
MADNTKKRGRPPKTATTPKVEENNNNQDAIIKQLMAQIEEQNKKMAEMQEQIANTKVQAPTIIQQTTNGLNSKKVKVVNLMHNALNISTQPKGAGRIYSFKEYGDVRFIKYDDLVDIVSCYPKTMEGGLAYICDKEVVDSLGLTEDYQKLFDKETMDRVIRLNDESDLELFLGMDDKLQMSTARKIAERINANEKVDYNYIKTIKERTEIDIEAIAKDLKDFAKKPNDEEE